MTGNDLKAVMIPVLLVAACGGTSHTQLDARWSTPQSSLAAAFPDCDAASVEQESPTDFRVTGCGKTATYSCETRVQIGRTCTLDTIGVGPATARAAPRRPAPLPAAPPPTSPDRRAEADRLFEDGRQLARSQRLDDACEQFERSDAIERTFGTALNLGDCAVRAGRVGRAWQLYDAAARIADRTGPAGRASFAREQAAALAPRLATVVVTIADPSVAGMTVRIGDRDVPPAAEIRTLVDPGEVEVVVSVSGVPLLHTTLRGVAGSVETARVPAPGAPSW